nr:MBL fold metallo-hydrolase [Dehalococcoidales bacterium]
MGTIDMIEQVHPQVYRVTAAFDQSEAHVYLLLGDQVALVDTCVAASVPRFIEPALRSLDLKLGDIDLIINTHAHHDHLGGNAAVRKASAKVKVLVHEADRPFTDVPDGFLTSEFDISHLFKMIGREDMLADRRATLDRNIGPSPVVDRWLKDGDKLDLGRGLELDVIHTPGHT